MSNGYKKICIICGGEFDTNRHANRVVTCSSECRRRATNNRIRDWKWRRALGQIKTRACVTCGKDFCPRTLKWMVCSTECERQRDNAAHRKQRAIKRAANPGYDRERRQAWRDANRERERARHRKYRATNREDIRQRERKCYRVRYKWKTDSATRALIRVQRVFDQNLQRMWWWQTSCVVCGREFTRSVRATKTCSAECRHMLKPPIAPTKKVCVVCDEAYYAVGQNKTCGSVVCRRAYRSACRGAAKNLRTRRERLAYEVLQPLGLLPAHLPLRAQRLVAYKTMMKHHPEFFTEGGKL